LPDFSSASSPASSISASSPVAVSERAPRRGAILLVEDRDDVRQGLAQLLELHGFLVADARTGEEALQQLTADPDGFALVLLDLVLPGTVSGRDVRLRQLSDPILSTVPTIVLTASDLQQKDRVGLDPDAWLDKPFRFDDLLELVRRYVVSEGSALQAD
jgi:DNA-binding response OmpR family regulator